MAAGINADMIVPVLLAVLFVVLGIVLLTGHGAWLIAGYNTLPKRTRERYDKRALCRFMGKALFVLAACILLLGAGSLWPGRGLSVLGTIALVATVLFLLVYANTQDRFLKK